MAWTYVPDFTTTRDQVRFLVGDTDPADRKLRDEEITWLNTQEPNVYATAAACARSVAAVYAGKASQASGADKAGFQQKFDYYAALAVELRQRSAVSSISPYAGGVSEDDKQSVIDDEDRVAPSFRVDLQNYPGTAEPDDAALAVPQ